MTDQLPYAFQKLDPSKLAWLAGLLQGEAEFGMDKRIRSKSKDPNYTPPPPIPFIKLEMVEKDLMEHIGFCVDENVVEQKRKTRAGKTVYRIRIQSRAKVEVFLRAILPYIIGEKNNKRILELLSICDEYNKWVAEGGRSKAASLAARSQKRGLGRKKGT